MTELIEADMPEDDMSDDSSQFYDVADVSLLACCFAFTNPDPVPCLCPAGA